MARVGSETAELSPQNPNQVQIRELIESIAPPHLRISGIAVATDANTRFNVHSVADFSVGDLVLIEGALRADHAVLANWIYWTRDHHNHRWSCLASLSRSRSRRPRYRSAA